MRLPSRVGPAKVGPGDPRSADPARRGFNQRFSGRPDYVRLVGSTADVVEAVQDAVREKARVVVRSGGHCLEGFVADPAVRVVVDTSLMADVSYDAERRAFVVEAGATNGPPDPKLFPGWRGALPPGRGPCPRNRGARPRAGLRSLFLRPRLC